MKNTMKERALICFIAFLFFFMTYFFPLELKFIPMTFYGFCMGIVLGDELQK